MAIFNLEGWGDPFGSHAGATLGYGGASPRSRGLGLDRFGSPAAPAGARVLASGLRTSR